MELGEEFRGVRFFFLDSTLLAIPLQELGLSK